MSRLPRAIPTSIAWPIRARLRLGLRACIGQSQRATLGHTESCWRAVLGALSPAPRSNGRLDGGALGWWCNC
jgi:hypothetical protein